MISTIVAVVLSIIALLIFTHLIIAKIFPLIKRALSFTKSEESLHSLMILLIFVIAIFAFSQILTLLFSLNNQYINILNILTPSLNLLLEMNKYFVWIIVAIIIALGLKK